MTEKGYAPLKDNYAKALDTWLTGPQKRPQPQEKAYMPEWPEDKKTHWQMYNRGNGTPVSPVMVTAEALATWLADWLWKEDRWKMYQLPYHGWMTVLTHKVPIEVRVLVGWPKEMTRAKK